MNKNHILVFPSDGTGCGLYRLIWPGEAVGAKTDLTVSIMQKRPEIVIDNNGQVHGINTGTAGTVIFQRAASQQYLSLIPLLQSRGIKIIIDMDDSLSMIHPRNPSHKFYDPTKNKKINWMFASEACKLADLVTVTTPALAEEYGQHGRVTIIPNHVPARYLKIERPENPIPVIGWAGWTNTHVSDLCVTRGMIQSVLANTKAAKFVAFGDPKIFSDIGVRYKVPNEHWGFVNVMEYPKKLVGFDIGLVPLQPSKFNEAKSWLKALEYASLGIVPVVSPTYDNMRLVEMGAAIVAETPKDWHDRVEELVLDHDMRKEYSERARKIASEWTIEGNTSKWHEAWSSVHK